MTLGVAPQQRAILDRSLAALPNAPTDETIRGGGELAALFYHPNTSCRVMALVLSAGFDAVGGRSEQAEKKLDRAIRVFTLVSDDATGRTHLERQLGLLTGDLTEFLTTLHNDIVPYLERGIQEAQKVVERPKASMPRPIEDGDEMPAERRTGKPPRPRRPAKPAEEEAADQGAVAKPAAEETVAEETVAEEATEAASEAVEASDEAAAAAEEPAAVTTEEAAAPAAESDADGDDDSAGNGPTEAEAAAAAAAALAAMEADYEDVVEDDAPPRFDPDRDLEPEDGGRRRRRRNRLEGLERPRADQVKRAPEEKEKAKEPEKEKKKKKEPEPEQEGDQKARTEARDGSEERDSEDDQDAIRVSRGAGEGELAESGLEALKLALRRAREAELDGNLRVEVTITRAAGDSSGGRRRRRRGRRRGRRTED